jgi:hypothetical protein
VTDQTAVGIEPLVPVTEPVRTARERILDEAHHPKPTVAQQMPSLLPGLIALILSRAISISIIILSVHADDVGGPPTYVLSTVFGVVVGAVAVYLGMSQRK